MEAGARRVYLIEEPLAAALGANLDVSGPDGHMVVDIGGGTTDIAVLTMNGVAVSSSITTAGDTFDDIIMRYLRRRHGMIIGENLAEEIKMTIGCVRERPEAKMEVKGRDAKTGLAKTATVESSEMLDVLRRPARIIADEALTVLERTSPELVADISRNGIVMTGGGSLIWGFDKLIASKTGIPTRVADEAVSCVAYGTGNCLENLSKMQDGTMNLSRQRQMKAR